MSWVSGKLNFTLWLIHFNAMRKDLLKRLPKYKISHKSKNESETQRKKKTLNRARVFNLSWQKVKIKRGFKKINIDDIDMS